MNLKEGQSIDAAKIINYRRILENTPADTAMIDGCKQNDRQAQERLYKRFYSPMVSICLRYTRNSDDAIEVLHNGFLKVFKHIETFEPSKASLFTWIRTIMIRSAIDFIRHRNRFTNHVVSLDHSDSPFIESNAIQRLSAQELLQIVRQLPAATQAVFNLYVIEGYNHKEVAGLMGISEGTSKWHLSNARKQLQKLLITLQL